MCRQNINKLFSPFFAILLFLTGLLPALVFGTENSMNVQRSACVPESEEAKNWPVKAIYLHGWYQTSGNPEFVRLERANRKKLARIASACGFRIAIPMARSVARKNGMRTWDNGQSLATVESLAKRACDGSSLIKNPALIGFSAGGYAARKLALESSAGRYSKILVLGAPPKRRSSVRPNMVVRNAHELGSNLRGFLNHLCDQPPSGSVKRADTIPPGKIK